jgi:hypothetical protein
VSDIYEVLRLNGILITIFAGAFPANTELVAGRKDDGFPDILLQLQK